MRAYVRPYATEAEDCAGNAYPVSEGGPLVIYQVFIAICLSSMAPKDCDIHSAVDRIAALELPCVPPTSIGKANIG